MKGVALVRDLQNTEWGTGNETAIGSGNQGPGNFSDSFLLKKKSGSREVLSLLTHS